MTHLSNVVKIIKPMLMYRQFMYLSKSPSGQKGEMDSLSIGDLPKDRLVVGFKQVLRGIEEGTVRCVAVASDADAFIVERVTAQAEAKGIEIATYPSKEQLGKLCRVAVPTATAALKVSK